MCSLPRFLLSQAFLGARQKVPSAASGRAPGYFPARKCWRGEMLKWVPWVVDGCADRDRLHRLAGKGSEQSEQLLFRPRCLIEPGGIVLRQLHAFGAACSLELLVLADFEPLASASGGAARRTPCYFAVRMPRA
jgi:hypothetical protein